MEYIVVDMDLPSFARTVFAWLRAGMLTSDGPRRLPRQNLSTSTSSATSWQCEPAAIICENVHRVKGLEFDYVVQAATAADTVSDALRYVGVSRALVGLTVIAASAIGDAWVSSRMALKVITGGVLMAAICRSSGSD